MLLRVTCLSSSLKMAAPTCCLKPPRSSFVLILIFFPYCYKFYWRTLFKQFYCISLSCVVSSTLNRFLWKLSLFFAATIDRFLYKNSIRGWNLSFYLHLYRPFKRWLQKEPFCAIFRSKIKKMFTINKWLIGANWGKLHFVLACGVQWSMIVDISAVWFHHLYLCEYNLSW